MSVEELSTSRVFLTIYVFRGEVDNWSNRRVLAYWTSPDAPNIFHTVYARREEDDPNNHTPPWRMMMKNTEISWTACMAYFGHVNGGTVQVPTGREAIPADIMASVPVANREQQTDWNGHHFVLEGLQKIVEEGLQSREWYERVEGQLIDKLLDRAVP